MGIRNMQVQSIQNQQNFNGRVYPIQIPHSKQMDKAIKHLNRMNKLQKSEANVYLVPETRNHNLVYVYAYATTNPINPNKLPLVAYWQMIKHGEKANPNNRDSIIEATKRTLLKYKKNNHFNEFVQGIITNQQKPKSNITQKFKNFINNILFPNKIRKMPENHAEMEKQALAEIVQRMQNGEEGPFKVDYYRGQKPKIYNLSDKK